MSYMRSKHYIDKRIAFFYPLRHMLLLHHTAAEYNFEIRIFFFYLFKRPYIAKKPVFSMLAYGTSVKKRNIRFFCLIRKSESHILEHAFQALTVGNIALTAESMHKDQWLSVCEPRLNNHSNK